MSSHAVREETFACAVVGLLLEFQASAVLHELSEFGWVTAAQLFKRRFNLLLLDGVVLLVLATAGQSLPGKRSLHQVEEDMADRFEVITSRLLDTLVRSDGSVSGRSSQILAILVGNMLTLAVFVALSETEIDDVDIVTGGLGASDQKVIRLDITMDDPLLVHLLDSLDQLDADQEACLEIEASLASREEVFKGWPEQVHHHHVEVLVWRRTVSANIVKSRHARYSNKDERCYFNKTNHLF